MTEEKDNTNTSPFDENADDKVEPLDELASLKARAATMAIKHHPNIGVDALKAKIKAALTGEPDPEEAAKPAVKPAIEEVVDEAPKKPTPRTKTKKELEAIYHTSLRREANKLVRIRLTCMNPDKTQWPGEVFDVGNSITGAIRKFVPFEAEDGYHVPFMIYEVLVNRKYQQHKKVRLPNGAWGIKSGLVREFAVELLEPLTKNGMNDLATRQALNHSID